MNPKLISTRKPNLYNFNCKYVSNINDNNHEARTQSNGL